MLRPLYGDKKNTGYTLQRIRSVEKVLSETNLLSGTAGGVSGALACSEIFSQGLCSTTDPFAVTVMAQRNRLTLDRMSGCWGIKRDEDD